MVLVGLHDVKVRPLALREPVLSIELELGGDDGVITPAVHIEGGLGEHEGAGVRHIGAVNSTLGGEGGLPHGTGCLPLGCARCARGVNCPSHLEETVGCDESIGTRHLTGATERMNRVGKGIDSISVVEGLGTEGLEEGLSRVKGSAIVDVGIGLDNPDEFLAGMVEVELDFVGGGAHGLVASELNLLDEVLVRVLCHLAALIGVKENIVNVEGCGDKGLLVSHGTGHGSGYDRRSKGSYRPQALAQRTDVEVNLDLVVLESNERQSETRVRGEPELKRNVESGLGERIAGGTYLGRAASGRAGTRDIGESGVGDIGESSGVTNHLEVTALLLLSHGELIPDMHPVTILAVNALTTDLNLNLGHELFANKVQPASIYGILGGVHALVDLGESHLKVGPVAKISIAGDSASDAATEVGLSGEGLLDGLHRKVGVATVRHFPEGNLGGAGKEHVLGAVSNKL